VSLLRQAPIRIGAGIPIETDPSLSDDSTPPDEPDRTGGPSDEGVDPVSIERELKRSYLDYAMSVIVSRALPDVRDGLKPVHRRILYAMQVGGNTPDKPYKKSANIVGAVMGNFHPHGDSAIYDALVRMAQPFSMGLPLVDGQGNFGSIDNDPPAAMRYTESRMEKAATYLLADIDKDTVDFQDNYDGSQQEPVVLPAQFPNLLSDVAEAGRPSCFLKLVKGGLGGGPLFLVDLGFGDL